jgi:hypothetical protein
MRLRSALGRGAVLGCALAAILPATSPAALAATSATGTATTSSARLGGLPMTSVDGRIRYVPEGEFPGLRATPLTSASGKAATGYDISWPECGGAMPSSSSIAIVGVDDGHPFSQNPCLQQEAAWASTAAQRAQYMVVDSPVGWSSANVLEYAYHGPAGACSSTDYLCQSYNWGYNAAYADVAYADSEGASSRQWWLDVELPTSTSINASGADCYQANFWVCDPKLNSTAILAAVAALRQQGKEVGVYSTRSQWQAITGGLPLGVPIWIAGFDYAPATYCDPANAATYWFALGYPALVQSLPATFDPDSSCLAD